MVMFGEDKLVLEHQQDHKVLREFKVLKDIRDIKEFKVLQVLKDIKVYKVQ
tara:strand:+ start:53 stop:205 length:153 start_codon:yes stop_codon:yes gene_type:complete